MARFGRSRKSGKSERKPDGQVRQSQMIGAYGAGALIDLLQHAVVVCGLDDWYHGETRLGIEEPRIRDILEERYKLSLDDRDYFRLAPEGSDDDPHPRVGVRVLEFPAWFVCQSCRRLLHRKGLRDATRADGRRYHDCRPKGATMVPVRFVGACPRGHLQDFPWESFVHIGQEMCPLGRELTLTEGRNGDFNDIVVRCSCGAYKKLNAVNADGFSMTCDGGRPWLPRGNNEPSCTEELHLLVRTASNGYFALVHSALSVPDPANTVRDELSSSASDLTKFSDDADFFTMFLKKKFADLIDTHGEDTVLKVAQDIVEGRPAARERTRTGEYKQLTTFATPQQTSEDYDESEALVARTIDVHPSIDKWIRTVTLVHRLKEIRVQFGFTRLEPPSADNQGEYDELRIRRAPLAVDARWLPAAVVRGEGIFLELCPDALDAWKKRKAVQQRAAELEAGFIRWFDERVRRSSDRKKERPPFLGATFYLLHALSHLLITSIAIECGYSASAIRERLYCGPFGDDPMRMQGILLYTGTVGSEGTLGGLVEQGARIHEHLHRALRNASLCSNDPLCAGHSPKDDPSDRLLEGAACHGCLFVSEPSCERFNQYLDRSLVVPVVGQDPDRAFFDIPEGWF